MENNKMELLLEGAEYRDIANKAKELGLNYVGVKKDALLAQVNEMITKINSGEVDAPEYEETSVVNNEDQNENEDGEETTKAESPAKAAAKRSVRTQKERTVRQPAKKWFEEPGAYPYQEGDVVEITSGKDLVGRKLHILEPSAKKDLVKGRLIHPVTGQLQGTIVAIHFDRLGPIENRNAEGTEVEESTNEVETNEVVEAPVMEENTEVEENNEESIENEESLTNGSEEEVDIPSLEVEEESNEEDQKAE